MMLLSLQDAQPSPNLTAAWYTSLEHDVVREMNLHHDRVLTFLTDQELGKHVFGRSKLLLVEFAA